MDLAFFLSICVVFMFVFIAIVFIRADSVICPWLLSSART
jgi:hypothetical protein